MVEGRRVRGCPPEEPYRVLDDLLRLVALEIPVDEVVQALEDVEEAGPWNGRRPETKSRTDRYSRYSRSPMARL